ncbi:MAG: outer membrane protein assembly factor BamD [Pirellulaceae bacterium]
MRKHRRLLIPWLGLALTWLAGGCALFTGRHAPDAADSLARSSTKNSARDTALVSHEESIEDQEEEDSAPAPLKLQDFTYGNIGTTVKRLTGRGPNRPLARELYGEGEELYRQAVQARDNDPDADIESLFLEASDKFAGAASRWPDSALEEDALFRAAESQFFADHYVKANDYFEQLLKKYPNTRYLDLVGARRFLIARYWLALNAEPGFPGLGINLTDSSIPWSDTFGHALRIYDRMRLDDPTGKLADDATIAAGNASFAKGNYDKADQYYSDLRTHFPSSEHQFPAHYLGIQAKLRGYRGANYTGNALEETDKLVQQILRQFPQEAREHQEELDRAARETRYLMAEREWLMARYYTRRKEYGAARFYIDALLKDYADTPFAQQARDEAGKMAGKPPVPPQRLSWLVELFPDAETTRPLVATASDGTKKR